MNRVQHALNAAHVQAKANETKYTGVSSEDVRRGGFGVKSATGFGSSSSSRGTLSAGGSSSSAKYRSGGGLGGSSFGSDSRGTLYDDYSEPIRTVDDDKVLLTYLTRPALLDARDTAGTEPLDASSLASRVLGHIHSVFHRSWLQV